MVALASRMLLLLCKSAHRQTSHETDVPRAIVVAQIQLLNGSGVE